LLAPLSVLLVTGVILGIAYEQSGDLAAVARFYAAFVTVAAVLAVLALALNIQWGYTGLFNFGVAGFFLVGAYTAALVTKAPDNDQYADYIGGFGPDLDILPFLNSDQWFPFLVALAAAGLASGILAFLLSIPTLRLRDDYLAITTIGIAELLRRIAIEEQWLGNGTRGLGGIPRPLEDLVGGSDYRYVLLVLAVVALALIYVLLERGVRSPWGRVLRAVREDELATEASGKSVQSFKTQSFVLGAVVMGMGGAMYALQSRAISPETFSHFFGTFLIWTMVMVGGSGNNNGAIVGAYVVWGFWQSTLLIQSYDLPDLLATRISFIRDMALGALIVIVLLLMPAGLIPEKRGVSIWAERSARRARGVQGTPPPGPAGTDGGGDAAS
jgi:branched-chain amino acid transport system permease protein